MLSMIGLYPAADRNSRVTLFVTNLQLAPTDVASSVKVRLTDSNSQNYEVGAEEVRVRSGFQLYADNFQAARQSVCRHS
jgi:hypothetical protein